MSKLPVRDDVKSVRYYRKPTPEDIKFGQGTDHFIDVDINDCIKPDGTVKKYIVWKYDGLRYYYR